MLVRHMQCFIDIVYLFQRAAVFKINKINLRSDPPLFSLSNLTGDRLKGYFYKEDLQPVPKLTPFLSQIVDQRVKNGVKQVGLDQCYEKLLFIFQIDKAALFFTFEIQKMVFYSLDPNPSDQDKEEK